MRISILEDMKVQVCAGAVSGRELLSKLLSLTAREPAAPESVLLDFHGIDVATASFLRESVIAFRDIVRGRRSNFYPVVANANEVIKEELEDVLQAKGGAMLACAITGASKIDQVRLLGRLESKQKKILDLITERHEVDAGQLQKEFGDSEGVKQTAWNNRLAALALAGLVVELSEGRNKRYRPLLEGV